MASGKLIPSTSKLNVAAKKSGQTANPLLSTEYVLDSSDDEEPDAGDAKSGSQSSTIEAQQPLVPNQKAQSEDSREDTSEEEDDDEPEKDEDDVSEDEEDDKSRRSTVPAVKKTQRSQDVEMDDAAEEPESDQDSSSDEDIDETGAAVQKIVKHVEGGSTAVGTKANKFRPPRGFEPSTVPVEYGSRELLTRDNLAGKEIWHITAPAHLSLSVIASAALIQHQHGGRYDNRIDGEQIVASRNGLDYVLQENASKDSPRWAYVPSAKQSAFVPTPIPISRKVRLQQTSRPGRRESSPSSMDVEAAKPGRTRPIPQQPQGLKMRYQPFGVANEHHLRRDIPTSRPDRSEEIVRPQSPEKRKAPRSTEPESPEKSSEKHRRHKRHKSNANGVLTDANGAGQPRPEEPRLDNTGDDGDGMEYIMDDLAPAVDETEGIDERSRVKEEKAKRKAEETPVERAKRHAEKKQRKEEKLARKAARQAKKQVD